MGAGGAHGKRCSGRALGCTLPGDLERAQHEREDASCIILTWRRSVGHDGPRTEKRSPGGGSGERLGLSLAGRRLLPGRRLAFSVRRRQSSPSMAPLHEPWRVHASRPALRARASAPSEPGRPFLVMPREAQNTFELSMPKPTCPSASTLRGGEVRSAWAGEGFALLNAFDKLGESLEAARGGRGPLAAIANFQTIARPDHGHLGADAGEFEVLLGDDDASGGVHFESFSEAEEGGLEFGEVFVRREAHFPLTGESRECRFGVQTQVSGGPGDADPGPPVPSRIPLVAVLGGDGQPLLGVDRVLGLTSEEHGNDLQGEAGVGLSSTLPHFATSTGTFLHFF